MIKNLLLCSMFLCTSVSLNALNFKNETGQDGRLDVTVTSGNISLYLVNMTEMKKNAIIIRDIPSDYVQKFKTSISEGHHVNLQAGLHNLRNFGNIAVVHMKNIDDKLFSEETIVIKK